MFLTTREGGKRQKHGLGNQHLNVMGAKAKAPVHRAQGLSQEGCGSLEQDDEQQDDDDDPRSAEVDHGTTGIVLLHLALQVTVFTAERFTLFGTKGGAVGGKHPFQALLQVQDSCLVRIAQGAELLLVYDHMALTDGCCG